MQHRDNDFYMHHPDEDRRINQSNRRQQDFESCPRFDKHELSEEQIVSIAKKAVLLAKDEFYMEVGKSVTTKFFMVVGVMSTVLLAWLTAKGYLR